MEKNKAAYAEQKKKEKTITNLEGQIEEKRKENNNLKIIEKQIKDIKELPARESKIEDLEEAIQVLQSMERHEGVLDAIKGQIDIKEKEITDKNSEIEVLKTKQEKQIKELRENKKQIEEATVTTGNQKKEITRLQRENGLLEEVNRNITDLNKALEFPQNKAGTVEKSSRQETVKTNEIENRKPRPTDPNTCKNGPKCRFLLENRCKFHHMTQEADERCKNGPNCKFLQRNRCRYKHETKENKESEIEECPFWVLSI